MKLKAYIDYLESIYLKHGDLNVDTYTFGGRQEASPPSVSYRKILTSRERRLEFWNFGQDEEKKGEKVVQV